MPRPPASRTQGAASGNRSVGAEASTLRAGTGAAHRQRSGYVLQGLALRVHAEERRDQAAHDHDRRPEQVAVEQRTAVLTVADERAVDDRAQGAEALGDREEDGDRLRPDLLGEDLADGQ